MRVKVLGVEVIECKTFKEVPRNCKLIGGEVTPEWAIRTLLKRKNMPKKIYYFKGQIHVPKENKNV